MCGIFAFITNSSSKIPVNDLHKLFNMIKHRGPDRSLFNVYSEYNLVIGFHRLSIMDVSQKGDQPFVYETDNRIVYAICNGEIYNYLDLKTQYNLETHSNSDCDILIPLFLKIGINLISVLRGEYAFTIFDINKVTNNMDIYISRDPFGIRPLFISYNENTIALSSEFKGLYTLPFMEPVLVGSYMHITRYNNNIEISYTKYNDIKEINCINSDLEIAKQNIYKSLIKSVNMRMMTDRPLGCLLSGGIDSSLIAAIAAKYLKRNGFAILPIPEIAIQKALGAYSGFASRGLTGQLAPIFPVR